MQEALERRGVVADVTRPFFAVASHLGIFEPQFPDVGPAVTIVIPTRNRIDLLRIAVELLAQTTYQNFDVLIVDNESDDPKTKAFLDTCGARSLRVASPKEGFSFAHLINAGVKEAKGDYVLFLNNDTKVRSANWLSQMMDTHACPGSARWARDFFIPTTESSTAASRMECSREWLDIASSCCRVGITAT